MTAGDRVSPFPWRSSGPRQTWFLSFAFDSGSHAVIAGGDDDIGIYRSETGAAPWRKVAGDFSAWCMAQDRFDSRLLVAGDAYGRGVLRSSDGGATWQRANTGFPGELLPLAVWAVEASPLETGVVHLAAGNVNNHGGAMRGGGVWRSTDGGASWRRIGLDDRHVTAVHAPPAHRGTLFAGFGGPLGHGVGGVVRSDDGGATWSPPRFEECGVSGIASEPESGRVHCALLGYGVISSDAALEAWHLGDGQDGARATWGVRLDPSCAGRLYSLVSAGASPCYRSDDGGKSWVATSLSGIAGIGLGVAPDGAVYLGTYDQGFHRSRDQGARWEAIDAGVSHAYVYSGVAFDPRDEDRVIVAAHFASRGGGGIYVSDDAGITYEAALTPGCTVFGNTYHPVFDPQDPNHVFAAFMEAGAAPHDGLWESRDRGRTWTVAGLPHSAATCTAIDANRPDVLWVGACDGLWRHAVADGGETRALAELYITSISCDPADADHIVVATGGINWMQNHATGFWETHDGGGAWRQLSVAADRGGYRAAFDATRPHALHLAHAGGLTTLDRSTGAAHTLLDRPSDLASCVAVDDHDGTLFYCGSNYHAMVAGCVLRSRDGGASWEDIAAGCGTREVWWLTLHPRRRELWASTFGSGVAVLPL